MGMTYRAIVAVRDDEKTKQAKEMLPRPDAAKIRDENMRHVMNELKKWDSKSNVMPYFTKQNEKLFEMDESEESAMSLRLMMFRELPQVEMKRMDSKLHELERASVMAEHAGYKLPDRDRRVQLSIEDAKKLIEIPFRTILYSLSNPDGMFNSFSVLGDPFTYAELDGTMSILPEIVFFNGEMFEGDSQDDIEAYLKNNLEPDDVIALVECYS